uniref:Uncharacterized protein n=1 Tax=Schistocephalus solidus TaxID=70667 RepID=A0A0V0J3Q2_SCHSO
MHDVLPEIVIQTQESMEESELEFVTFVPALNDLTAKWTKAKGTLEMRCSAPKPCIQFYPHRASMRLISNPENRLTRFIFTPEMPTLPKIAVTMMRGDMWLPEVDEVIKDIFIYKGITNFSETAPNSYMKIKVPYCSTKKADRNLMRLTGRMKNRNQTVKKGPSKKAQIRRKKRQSSNWPKRNIGE